jgi:hypothetical protein
VSTTPLARKHRAHRGTVFASSWGYDQTNVDYYVVVSATAKMARVRRLKRGTNPIAVGTVLDMRDDDQAIYLEPEQLVKIHDSTLGEGARVDADSKYSLWFKAYSFANAYVWRGEELYETPAGFGH